MVVWLGRWEDGGARTVHGVVAEVVEMVGALAAGEGTEFFGVTLEVVTTPRLAVVSGVVVTLGLVVVPPAVMVLRVTVEEDQFTNGEDK